MLERENANVGPSVASVLNLYASAEFCAETPVPCKAGKTGKVAGDESESKGWIAAECCTEPSTSMNVNVKLNLLWFLPDEGMCGMPSTSFVEHAKGPTTYHLTDSSSRAEAIIITISNQTCREAIFEITE